MGTRWAAQHAVTYSLEWEIIQLGTQSLAAIGSHHYCAMTQFTTNLSRERKNTEFNKQFRERSSIILANLERASIQDIVMSLSAISWRLSLLLPGSRSLRISDVLQQFVSKSTEYILKTQAIEKATYAQLSSLIWAHSCLTTIDRDLWS